MKDRVPTIPNRYLLTDAENNSQYVTLTRADAPTEAGTPINKANLLSDTTATVLGLTGNPTVNDALYEVANKIGDIKMTKRTNLGSNWALCNGAVLPITDYTELSQVVTKRAPTPFTNTESLTSSYPPCPLAYGGGYYVGVAASTLYYSTNKNGPFSTKTFTGTAEPTSIIFGVNYFCFVATSGSTVYMHTFKPSALAIKEYSVDYQYPSAPFTLVHLSNDIFVGTWRKSGYYSYQLAVVFATTGTTQYTFEFQYIYTRLQVTSATSFTLTGRSYDGSQGSAYCYSFSISGTTVTRSDMIYLTYAAWEVSSEGGQRFSIGNGKYIAVYANGAISVTESSSTKTMYNIPSYVSSIQRDGFLSADLKYYYLLCYSSTTSTYKLIAFDTVNRVFYDVTTFSQSASSPIIRSENEIQLYVASSGLYLYTRPTTEGIVLPVVSVSDSYSYIKVK